MRITKVYLYTRCYALIKDNISLQNKCKLLTEELAYIKSQRFNIKDIEDFMHSVSSALDTAMFATELSKVLLNKINK